MQNAFHDKKLMGNEAYSMQYNKAMLDMDYKHENGGTTTAEYPIILRCRRRDGQYYQQHHRPNNNTRRKSSTSMISTNNIIARISLLSSFFIVATSSINNSNKNDATTASTPTAASKSGGIGSCKPHIALNLNFLKNPTDIKHLDCQSPRDVPQLGDGIRSSEASGVFFDSLDRDGDGAIEPEEVALFLQEEIGGKSFDTSEEVVAETNSIMERLDQNHNDGLEMSDMLDYWTQLESLLTAEEVAEWIVYSVQLPATVGKIFLENGITGYDFLEIVDNGGQVLQNDLGIDKASFRNKIVRQMQARMLGIGSSPGNPANFAFKLESCKATSLTWDKSTARVFPVHSYRIQRRTINLFGGSSAAFLSSNDNSNFDSSNSDWKTVYVGTETEFVDSGLDTGHNYMYRIQAWNSAGRSGWETIDLSKALKKQKCSTKPATKLVMNERGVPIGLIDTDTHQSSWLSIPKQALWGIVALVQFLYHSVRFFFALTALLAGMMRYRRATASSSASAQTILPFPWFWRGINRLSLKYFDQEIIPKTMLGDKEALMRQEQLHDEQIMATGLRGYDRLRKTTREKSGGSSEKTPPKDKRRTEDIISGFENRRTTFSKVKSNSTGNLTASTLTLGPPREVVVPREGNTPNKFGWMRPVGTKRTIVSFGGISETSENSTTPSPKSTTNGRFRGKSSMSSQSDHPSSRHPRRATYTDDGSRCSECEKKFRIGKRYKHHCARCMATFCHKHGRTTHSNFTSCKVPGDCICDTCLREKSERSRM